MIGPETYNVSSYSGILDDRTAGRAVSGYRPDSKTSIPEVEKKEGSFLDVFKAIIDIVNPLQHIPIVSTLYRHLTGDEINPVARVAGDTLYGGPVGAALSVADLAYEKASGKTAGETMLAALTGSPDSAAPTRLASLDPKIQSRPSSLPTHPHTAGTGGLKPAEHPTPAHVPPVQSRGLVAAHTAFRTTLASQDAPAAPRTGMPPELIAAKMMDALDKYQVMKRAPGGMVSASY